VSKKSTLKFFDGERERGVVSAFDITKTNDGYRLTTTAKICVNDKVNLIADADLEKRVSELFPSRKINISLEVISGKPLRAIAEIEGQKIIVEGDVAQPAINRPTEKEEIENNFKKSKTLDCDINFMSFEKVFVVKSSLNEFRRRVFEEVEKALTKVDRKLLSYINLKSPNTAKKFTNFAIVQSLGEITDVKEKNVIYSPESYNLSDVLEFKSMCLNMNKCAYLDTPNFATKEDINLLREIIEQTGVSIVANNYYALSLTDDYVVGGGLNVYNTHTASIYQKEIISAESNVGTRQDYAYMTLRHCPIKEHDGGSCDKCRYVENQYTIRCEDGKEMKVKRKKLKTCTFYLAD
jgi:hypothetical protein